MCIGTASERFVQKSRLRSRGLQGETPARRLVGLHPPVIFTPPMVREARHADALARLGHALTLAISTSASRSLLKIYPAE